MGTLALIVLCGFASLTQTVTTQPLPRDLANLEENRAVVKSLFFIERTITIPVGSFEVDSNAQFILWETTSKHTSTNAVETNHGIGEYRYLFATDKDIVIFDRRPNTPIWYALAAAATVVAMFGFYIIVKRRSASKDVSAQGQYQSPDSSRLQ